VGILEDLGFQVPGKMSSEGRGDNKRGTRESSELNLLADRILQLNASSWSRPPQIAVKYIPSNVKHRNRVIRLCVDGQYVMKDPRMLLMPELWGGVTPHLIGVVRNPVDVAHSLLRRGEPSTLSECVALWKVYNRALLHLVQTHDCPIAVFDYPHFADQILSCVRHHGYDKHAFTPFFDDALIRSRSRNWRQSLDDIEAVALYDSLTRFAITGSE
jgi:hypothetical protein